jgi:hypothetical protein
MTTGKTKGKVERQFKAGGCKPTACMLPLQPFYVAHHMNWE